MIASLLLGLGEGSRSFYFASVSIFARSVLKFKSKKFLFYDDFFGFEISYLISGLLGMSFSDFIDPSASVEIHVSDL